MMSSRPFQGETNPNHKCYSSNCSVDNPCDVALRCIALEMCASRVNVSPPVVFQKNVSRNFQFPKEILFQMGSKGVS